MAKVRWVRIGDTHTMSGISWAQAFVNLHGLVPYTHARMCM